MRSGWGYLARYFTVFLDKRSLSFGVALVLSAAALGLAFVGGSATGEAAEEYSAYSDPEKPALSFILSEEQNVEEFQREFALSDEEMDKVLAAIRKENEALAQTYAESERIIETNAELSEEEVQEKIAASDYDEEVEAAVAETKSTIEALLPAEERQELRTFADAQWQQQARRSCRGTRDPNSQPRKGSIERVFATQYHGYTNFEVALPHRKLKFDGGYRVRISWKGRSVWAPVKEVGPWNTYDNYWQSRKYRTMWKKLPRGKPEAEAAWCNHFHNGKDENGRKVLNPAGIDLTPAVASRLGLKKYQNAWVVVYYPWVRR